MFWSCLLSMIVAFPLCSASFQELLFGEDPNEDRPSLFEAIAEERVGNVQRLLDRGVLLEEKNEKGLTPLLFAVDRLFYKESLIPIVQILVENGAFLESRDAEGCTALHRCCRIQSARSRSLVEWLLEQGADLEARDLYKNTPLLVAAAQGYSETLSLLLEKNADKEARDKQSLTALILATTKNHVQAVRVLLQAGVCVDPVDNDGISPLMIASYSGYVEVMQLLLQYNADVALRTTKSVEIVTKEKVAWPLFDWTETVKSRTVFAEGSTALDFALRCGGRGVEKLLLEAWVKKDPSWQHAWIEWKRRAAEL